MKNITKIAGAGLLLTAINAHAGFNGTTSHSRANCAGFNESITWNWNEYHWWEVQSIHTRLKGKGPDSHQIFIPMSYTWRCAAFDFWVDPAGGNADQYRVDGYHAYKDRHGNTVYDNHTWAVNCAIYDGWWDREKQLKPNSNCNMIRKEYDAKPMIQGNTRAQELMEWDKDHPGEMPPLTEQEKYEIFIKRGIPLPGSGVTIVDNIKALKMSKEEIASSSKFNFDQKTKGYYETSENKAKILLSMPEIAEKQYNERKSIAYDPHDTHLYEVKNNLAMAYDYKGVPESLVNRIIGYSPEQTFVNNGWTGAVEYFIPNFDAICEYHEVNIGITKSAAFILKEVATYDVNGKVTTTDAVGTKNTGFVYNVEWWDKEFRRSLDCASKDYSVQMKKNTLELAKKIDKS